MESSSEERDDNLDVAGSSQQTNKTECSEGLPAQMTASYSEICATSPDAPRPPAPRPPPLHAGYVHHEGDMTHFVADDLEFKIKLSSPLSRPGSRSGTPGARGRGGAGAGAGGLPDVAVLTDLEHEAQRIAHSVDTLIENLSGILHSNSSLTAENMEVYKDAVSKTCEAMDNNIKSMYTILAKGEEVSQAMRPVQAQAARIAEIKRLLHIFENNL